MTKLDRVAITLITLFSFIIGGFIWTGKACGENCWLHTGPRVTNFNWDNRTIGAEDQAFVLTFDRPMDHSSVEENLDLEPKLPGKFSWSGKKVAYTLLEPAVYGTEYKLKLQGARERFLAKNQLGEVIEPFNSQFKTRDRAFVYIGITPEEQGRLILFNFTTEKKQILTPNNLIVLNFKPYPQGDQILFAAIDRGKQSQGIVENQLYRIKTGLNQDLNPQDIEKSLELVLDNQNYQNLQFDLAENGKTIVIQRVNRKNPGDFGLWVLRDGKNPQPLNNQPGGDFMITPDSQAVALTQGEGIAILPLEANAEPLDFLAKYGQIVTFSQDGRSAAMINFNTDNANLRYTRSLYLVNNQNKQQKLLDTEGSILDCKFNPNATILYCLITELANTAEYQEKPYFVAIDLKTNQVFPLVALPEYQDIKLSIANDGLGILFDQQITKENAPKETVLRNNSGAAIINSRLWLLITPKTLVSNTTSPKIQLEELPLVGFSPQWLP